MRENSKIRQLMIGVALSLTGLAGAQAHAESGAFVRGGVTFPAVVLAAGYDRDMAAWASLGGEGEFFVGSEDGESFTDLAMFANAKVFAPWPEDAIRPFGGVGVGIFTSALNEAETRPQFHFLGGIVGGRQRMKFELQIEWYGSTHGVSPIPTISAGVRF